MPVGQVKEELNSQAQYQNPAGRGRGRGYFLVVDLWVCATGCCRIFTTGLTIKGLHFYKSYYNGIAHFEDFGGQKNKVCRDFKIGAS